MAVFQVNVLEGKDLEFANDVNDRAKEAFDRFFSIESHGKRYTYFVQELRRRFSEQFSTHVSNQVLRSFISTASTGL